MSTQAMNAAVDAKVRDPYTSLDYLVTPIPAPAADSDVRFAGQEWKIANSLQVLTNLVYLLTRDSLDEQERRTTLTLLQAELAHFSVLIRSYTAAPTANGNKGREDETTDARSNARRHGPLDAPARFDATVPR